MATLRPPERAPAWRQVSTLGVAAVAVLFIAPFAVNSFFQGRQLLGVLAFAIIATLALSVWSIRRRRYRPWLTLVAFVPLTILILFIGLRTIGVLGLLWCYPAVLIFYVMLPERQAWVSNGIAMAVVLPEAWEVFDTSMAARATVTLVAVSAFSAIFTRVITLQQERLEAQAVTDSLTGLANRQLLDATLEQAVERHQRAGTPMTLISMDLDHFKSLNDTLGHEAGDTVLREVGALLGRRVRRADAAFRLGGEEFLVLLYDAGAGTGRKVAEELRGAVAALGSRPGQRVTASFGVATLRDGEAWKDWVRRSDEQLYRAKAAGRNAVASDEADAPVPVRATARSGS